MPSIELVREALADLYAIDRELGRGGMATVYLARDLKHDRTVALKVLHRELAAALGADRFLREIKVAASLNHPHILPLFDSGSAGSFIYYVMPYVAGESLRARLDREGQLPVVEAVHHARGIASALDYAHRQGVVHRDIKPENIMLHEGEAMVMDFGIAKALSVAGTETLTQAGVMVGTPAYVSPEQASGDTLDARTDQYSLACVLYEMLTGQRPFTGPTVPAMIARRLTHPVSPVRTLRDSVPENVNQALTRAMSIDPDGRYATAAEFADALAGAVPAAPVARAVRKPWGRRAAIGAVAVLIMATIAYAMRDGVPQLTTRGSAVESIAVMPFLNESRDPDGEYLSDGMTETLITSLSQLPNLSVKARSSVFRYKGREVNPQTVGDELSVQALLLGRVTERADELTVSLELVDARTENVIWSERYNRRPVDLASLQTEIARDVSEKLRLTLSRSDRQRLARPYTANSEAYQLYLKGRFYWNKRTEDGFKRAIEYFQQAIEKDPSFATAYSGLADSYYLQGVFAYVPPNEAMPRAKAAAERALAIDDQLAEAHASLGGVMMDFEWNFAESERHFRQAIALNPNYATAHQWYAELLSIVGNRTEEALAEIKRAKELDPLSLIINNVHGHVLFRARRYDEAIAEYRKTIELDPNFRLPYLWLVQAYEQKGLYEEAIAAHKAAGPLGNNPRNLGNLGHVYAAMGRRDDALRVIAQLKDLSKQKYVSPTAIAMVYSGLGDRDQAIAWLEKAYVERNSGIAWMKVEPKLDVLRSDPRFQDLMRRVGFPE